MSLRVSLKCLAALIWVLGIPGLSWGKLDLNKAFANADRSQEVLVSYFTSNALSSDHLNLKYAGVHYRYIWNFQKDEEPGPWSFMAGGFAETPVYGPGSYIVGGFSGVRWSHSLGVLGLTGYIQGSIGIFGNDIYKDETQDDIGNFIEFRDTLTLGVATPLGDESSPNLTVEVSIEHISNGGLDPRNGGVNLLGLMVGLNY
jgi:hypothetical protein